MNTLAHFILSTFMFATVMLLFDTIANILNKRYKITQRVIIILPLAAFCATVYTGGYLIPYLKKKINK